MENLNITSERKREIDAILKETERKYKNGEIKSISLEEFKEKQKRKRKVLAELIERKW